MVDELLAAVKYRFIVAIEACIDVGRHVVASEGLRAPADYDVRVVQILRERVDDLVTFRSALARAAGADTAEPPLPPTGARCSAEVAGAIRCLRGA